MGQSGRCRLRARLADLQQPFCRSIALSLSDLERNGFDVQTVNHALAVLTTDFTVPLEELCGVLLDFKVADVDIAHQRVEQLRAGTLRTRPMGKPVYDPTLPNGGHR